jgi:hypothetical protein
VVAVVFDHGVGQFCFARLADAGDGDVLFVAKF